MPYVTDVTTVSYTLSTAMYAYLKRTIELGAIEGELGEMHMLEALRPIFEASHEILAGGKVEVSIEQRGNPDIVRELNRRAEEATEMSNTINRAAGYYVTFTP